MCHSCDISIKNPPYSVFQFFPKSPTINILELFHTSNIMCELRMYYVTFSIKIVFLNNRSHTDNVLEHDIKNC